MLQNNNNEQLRTYMKLMDFFADFLGTDYEMVLHDVSNIENSIVYIKNNFSGRKAGGSITQLGLRFIKEKTYEGEDYCVNYTSTLADGRTIRSATYFIKDDDGELKGILCINFDVTKAMLFDEYLRDIIKGQKTIPPVEEVVVPFTKGLSQTLCDSIEDVAQYMMNEAISKFVIPVERMSLEEKKEVVCELDNKGFFLIKGSVKSVANRLQVSEATVYRCINSGS